jgi:hypothetical protein
VSPAVVVSECVPLWSRLLTTIREVITRSGMSPERGLGLYCTFQEADLAAPHMRLEMPLALDASVVQLQVDLLRTIHSAADEHHVSLTDLGNLDTLADRIHAEAMAANSPIAFPAIVSAWSKKAS